MRVWPRCLTEYKPDEVIDIVKKSGLRGRGGAGFPAGLKWEHTQEVGLQGQGRGLQRRRRRPGRVHGPSLMEGDPHSVIEGMIINAYAIGAQHGYVYVRHEYPLAVKNLTIAIKQARGARSAGQNILGSGLDFRLADEGRRRRLRMR